MDNKMLRNFILFIVMIFSFLAIYWIKSRAGINLSESISLSGYWPFEYFRRNKIISVQQPGIIFNDSFDSSRLLDPWVLSWMKEKGKVAKVYDTDGGFHSRCLLIRSESEMGWVCSYLGLIKVKQGDRFSFTGAAKLKGDKVSAYAGVSAFDRDKNAITWNYLKEGVGRNNLWLNFNRSFSVSDKNIKYIRFRISGIGIGEFRFDDICFKKERAFDIGNKTIHQ